jgi:hypothetical protein
MSPEAIQSLIKLFGVEKGLHILNLFTAMDDTGIAQHLRRTKPKGKASKDVIQDMKLQGEAPAVR